MEYEDRLSVATPEGVDLELSLAGLGSRFIAGVADLCLKGLLIGLAAILLAAAASGGVAAAIFIAFAFLVYWLFDVPFEVLAAGRTPGKRFTGLRVVTAGGAPVGLRESLTRNLVRLLDGPASFYVAGSLAILLTRHNQRLGDLAAGTLVLRERRAADRVARAPMPAHIGPAARAAYDVSSVSASDLSTVRAFLERRDGLEQGARAALAADLAARLAPKVAGAPPGGGPETFLEWLAAARGGGARP